MSSSDFGLIEGDFSPDGADFGVGERNNGRVANVGPGTGPPAPFQLFSDQTSQASSQTFASDTLRHVWRAPDARGPNELFLSKANVDALQDAIRYRVYVETDGQRVIGRQSDAELALVMRSILLQSGRNDPTSDATVQVRELNAQVLAWCVPRIVAEVGQYLRYREDVSTLPAPMPIGGLSTMKGSRQIETKRFF